MSEMNDHDVLITLVGKVDQLRTDIKELKEASNNLNGDHEARIRRLEKWGFISVGVLYALQFYFSFIHKL